MTLTARCSRFENWTSGCDGPELFIDNVVECAKRMRATLDELQTVTKADPKYDDRGDRFRSVDVPDKFAKYFSPNPGEGD